MLFSRKPSSSSPDTSPSSETEALTRDTDAMQRFTATGRPMPTYTPSALANTATGTSIAEAPQFLPVKFTDDSILTIPIPLSKLYPSAVGSNNIDTQNQNPVQQERRRWSVFGKSGGKEEKDKGGFKMVKMTRREYLMYWAKDEQGRYIGTEPEGDGRKLLLERGEI
ncbi:MAG: hypothetical protein Q9190_004593 [Brigantiaea leucoxantha]